MRIAFTSDIHIDITRNNRALLPHLAEAATKLEPDVFVIAGDVANTAEGVDEALAAFEGLRCHKLFVPGNHDVWVESQRSVRKGKDSWHKHDVVLPEICAKRDFTFLPGRPLVIDDVLFAGSLGWYDYSMADPRLEQVFDTLDYARGEFKHPNYHVGQWMDVRNACWLMAPGDPNWRKRRIRLSDRRVCEMLQSRLDADLRAISTTTRSVVAVVHTSAFLECVERSPTADPFNAYAGSTHIGEMLSSLAQSAPAYCISGHLHEPLDTTVDGVRVLRSPVGYIENFRGDLRERAEEAIGLVEI
jgi:Calcineurin-like phosphoesterase